MFSVWWEDFDGFVLLRAELLWQFLLAVRLVRWRRSVPVDILCSCLFLTTNTSILPVATVPPFPLAMDLDNAENYKNHCANSYSVTCILHPTPHSLAWPVRQWRWFLCLVMSQKFFLLPHRRHSWKSWAKTECSIRLWPVFTRWNITFWAQTWLPKDSMRLWIILKCFCRSQLWIGY
jgi:hypothetical protein